MLGFFSSMNLSNEAIIAMIVAVIPIAFGICAKYLSSQLHQSEQRMQISFNDKIEELKDWMDRYVSKEAFNKYEHNVERRLILLEDDVRKDRK